MTRRTESKSDRKKKRRVGIDSARSAKQSIGLLPTASERSSYRRAFELARPDDPSKYPLAAKLLKEAHSGGDRRATYALATWYIHGRYFPIDAHKAFRFLKQSAKAGIPEAIFDLGHAYEVGFGTKKSPEAALGYYVKAAAQGDRQAAEEVFRCIFWGIGTRPNRSLAYLIDDLVRSRIEFSVRKESSELYPPRNRPSTKK